MKKYQWVLFDIDKTLLHFNDSIALQEVFSQHNFNFTENDFQHYQTINKNLWSEYQRGLINLNQLYAQRFAPWENQLQTPSTELNNAFLASIINHCALIDGAINVLDRLKGKAKLGVISNATSQFQHTRLEKTGIKNYFDLLVISEEVGIAKPDPRIFNHAFTKMGNPNLQEILMVGDTLEADILGGINAGIDTCWLNMENKPASASITPHFEVSSLFELENLLSKTFN